MTELVKMFFHLKKWFKMQKTKDNQKKNKIPDQRQAEAL
jgi:hypothetical protein